MADTIVIRLHDNSLDQVSWHPTGKNPSPQSPRGAGTLEDAGEKLRGWRLLAIAPASDILLTKVSIPSKNKQRLAQAIPFALENDLTEDLEQLHIAFDPHTDRDATAVAVISRQRLESWLERFSVVGLQPLAIFPESLCLPLTSGHWTIHMDRDGALLRMANNSGLATETQNLPTLLRISLDQTDSRPDQLDLYLAGGMEQGTALSSLEVGLKIDVSEYTDDLTSLLAEHLDEKHTLNLLQGEYQQVDQTSLQWRRWLPAAALFTVLIAINVSSSIIDYAQYKKQSVLLSNEIQRVFREAFPDTKRIVDPKVQMEQQLRLLADGKQHGHEDFLDLLTYPADSLIKAPGSRLESINYRDNQLDLKVTLKDLQSLEMIKKSIETHADLVVEIKSANASGNQVTSHLRIKRNSI